MREKNKFSRAENQQDVIFDYEHKSTTSAAHKLHSKHIENARYRRSFSSSLLLVGEYTNVIHENKNSEKRERALSELKWMI